MQRAVTYGVRRNTTQNLSNVQVEDQVSKFLHCCMKILSDLDVANKLMHMLTRCMGEEDTIVAISTPIPNRDVHQVRK